MCRKDTAFVAERIRWWRQNAEMNGGKRSENKVQCKKSQRVITWKLLVEFYFVKSHNTCIFIYSTCRCQNTFTSYFFFHLIYYKYKKNFSMSLFIQWPLTQFPFKITFTSLFLWGVKSAFILKLLFPFNLIQIKFQLHLRCPILSFFYLPQLL